MAKITTYTISATGRKALEKDELGPQASLVLSTLGKKDAGMTSAELSSAVEKSNKLTTKQPVPRVVGFYLAQFKADSMVKISVTKTADEKAAKPAKKATKKAAKKAAKKSSVKAKPNATRGVKAFGSTFEG
jgi:hypothetical protein